MTPTEVRQAAAGGARMVKIFPAGNLGPSFAAAIRSVGYRQMMWTVDPQDWRSGRSAATISNFVLSRLHRNAVVVLHDGVGNSPNTIRALPAIIDGARSRGYCFGVLDGQGQVDLAGEVGHEHERALEDGDEQRLLAGVVIGDGGAELGDARLQLVCADEHVADGGVVGVCHGRRN
jgi:hypothetical protein